MKNITFDEICELEPELYNLYRMASMIGRKRNKPFCANTIWYDIFRPRLKKLVGWSRVATPEVDFAEELKKHTHRLSEIDLRNLPPRQKIANKITCSNPASRCKDEILWSSEAYDIAYHAIYKALPDCRGCGCC